MLRRSPERHRGNVVAAAPGTREAAGRMVERYCKPDAVLLDFGACTGALIQRLKDRGDTNVTAADLDNPAVRHVACDFNEGFGGKFPNQQFDCLIASAVIEHLNDVRAFLRECRA